MLQMTRKHTEQHDEDRSPVDEDLPTTLPAFVKRFPDEGACLDYLFWLRFPEGFECPKCGTDDGHWMDSRPGVIACKKGHQTSLTAGTALHGTRTDITTWFYAAYLVSTLTPGVSALQLQKQLGITRYETAYQILQKLRASLVDPDRTKLTGYVEVDECFVGGAGHGAGRGTTNPMVVVAVEVVDYTDKKGKPARRAGRVRMEVVPNAKEGTLVGWVAEHVDRGATVATDGFTSYRTLPEYGYNHVVVFQQKDGEATGEFMPMVHLIISNFKRWLLGTYKGAVRPQHLPAYLNEFVFRFNRRFWRGPAFARALGLAVSERQHPTYDDIYGVRKGEAWMHPNPEE